jgi:DNA (cytosine-5)-methyltransferase 1
MKGEIMRFVDLFAGLGGFNLALSKLGNECVFACEIDETLRKLYKRNFGMDAAGDIRLIDSADIPSHDILCAGFPCQPFSKAGYQKGFDHPEIGELYLDILRIIKFHHPRYIILENVPNLQRHGNGETWKKLEVLLRDKGYDVSIKRLSPHHFGVPQIRERVYIVGTLGNLNNFEWPEPLPHGTKTDIKLVLDKKPLDARYLSPQVLQCIEVWQEFLDQIPASEEIPLPIWSMEFGATYLYKDTTPSQLSLAELHKYRGNFGCSLRKAKGKQEVLSLLPPYARGSEGQFPTWKIKYIEQNREFYRLHKKWLDKWKTKINGYPSSFQKFEWNCHGEKDRRLVSYMLQVRPSGVRVKRPTTAPSLVAMTATQVPIITWEKRYMTPTECKRLQSMDSLQFLPTASSKAYEALGNAVNVEVVRRVAMSLIKPEDI